MDAPVLKNKRRRKNKSRTEVSDSDSDSPASPRSSSSSSSSKSPTPESLIPKRQKDAAGNDILTDAEVTTAFTQFYTRQAAQEFAEDLDRVRQAEDFNRDALPLLITALQQGAGLFSIEEQRRVVLAEREKEKEGKVGG